MTTKTAITTGRMSTLLAVLLVAALPAHARPELEILDAPGPGPWADFSLSRDGSQMGCVIGGAVYWWAEGSGFRFLDQGVPTSGGVGMAADGSALIAAQADGAGAAPAVWFRDGTSISLGSLVRGCDRSHPADGGFDLSVGGRVAVGQATDCTEDVAFQWTRASGLKELSTPPGSDSRGTAVSADGRVVVGFCEHPDDGYRRPVLWRDGAGPEFFLGLARTGEALGVSLDGRRVVGQADRGGVSPQAFIWSAADGLINLGSLGGHATDSSLARAVSDDGRVVGWSGDALWGDQAAFLWTAAAGMRALAAVLADAGVTLPDGMILTAALDISGDGRTVVGVARDRDWTQHYWRVRLDDSTDTAPAAPSRNPDPLVSDPTDRDSMDVQQADVFDLFPFTRRRY